MPDQPIDPSLPPPAVAVRRAALLALALLLAAPAHSGEAAGRSPDIRVDDVARFYAVYDAAGGKPTAAALQQDYLDKGSPGLARFAKLRNITGERIAAAIEKRPALFADARACAARLPRIKARLSQALTRLVDMYPATRALPVTIAVGRGKPVGTADAAGAYIGIEALCDWEMPNPDKEDRFVHVIAHEYVHIQQVSAEPDPTESVRTMSLIEGGAELIGELTSDAVAYQHLAAATAGKEKALEEAFVRDADKPAMGSDWLYNGIGTPERPGDLGYWVGYRIAKAYYARAADKRAAVKAIIEMRDPKAFVAQSGWYPGIKLD